MFGARRHDCKIDGSQNVLFVVHTTTGLSQLPTPSHVRASSLLGCFEAQHLRNRPKQGVQQLPR